ncbi:Oxygen-regulated protein 1 [Toxocara canis]|uniref:Oxygen-regulated protein 1 n=2 Tax=Toxocara canis TaxID=6265 RepID=A0A0B2UQW3_TOXCA|nr:Oxygen-regulated protein 1 [Toxocara canis]
MDASTNRSATLLPNLPDPVNGKIKTYDCSHRTFTRPYSAKTVFFYKEGDNYFTGVRVPVSKARYRNMDSLLDDLNSNIQMPFGVRRLTTPLGRTHIETIDQLQHLGRYIASSTKAARPLNFAAIEQMQRTREEQHQQIRRDRSGGTSFWMPTSPSFNAKLRMSRSLGISYLPVTAKQMLFVLNGKPSRIYRALLNPMRMKTFDALLEEVSQGLQIAIFKIYTYAGHRVLSIDELMSMSEARVLAVPRHERPILKKHAVAPLVTSLPPISQEKMSKSTSAATSRKLSSTTGTKSSSNRVTSPYNANSIERPRQVKSTKRMPLTRQTVSMKREATALANDSSKRKRRDKATGTKSSSNRVTSPYNANSIERPRQVKSTKRMPLTRQTVSMKREATALANDSSKRKRRDKVNTNDTFVVDSPRVLKMVGKDDNDSGRPQSPEEVDLERSKSSENQTEVTDENANKVEGEVGDENTPSRGTNFFIVMWCIIFYPSRNRSAVTPS